MKHALALAVALLVSGCGGQVTAKPLTICYQPSDRIAAVAGCDASVQHTTEADPVKSVAHQAMQPGPVVLWAGRKEAWPQAVTAFPALIAETRKYPGKFVWVNMYDEPGWCPEGFCWFTHEDSVLQGAALARANGIKTLMTIMPDVILDPRFALKDINAFDGISIDVYPSIRPTVPNFGNCRFSANHLENLFYCSAQKLRALGFRGQVGYIFQGFGMRSDTHEHRMQYLTQQRQAINNASAMGADAVMSWGCWLGADEQAAEPILEPLCNTQYESLVTP
jgi:hypothetical protein